MKALLFDEPKGPEALYLGTVPDPVVGPNDVLIANVATSVNRGDLLQLKGQYPVEKPSAVSLGMDAAGTVIEVGENVTDFAIGDNVCALVREGAFAQLVAAPAAMCLRLPGNLSFTKAAAIPEVFITAYLALHQLANLQSGEHVLIHAGASGVGTAAIQLAHHYGATVCVTASAGKHEHLKAIGADCCIDYRTQDFDEVVLKRTNGKGANVLLDFIGAPYAAQNVKCIAMDGRIVALGMLGGRFTEGFDSSPFIMKRLTLFGSTLRNRPQPFKEALLADFNREIWPLFASRELHPIVDSIFDWDDAVSGLKYMEANANVGKIVITIGAD